MQFKLGDVVRLKSGGPDMTFSETREDGFIVTAWFIGDEGPFEAVFEPEMLELAVDEDGFYCADGADDAHSQYVDDVEEISSQFRRGDLSDEHLDALVADSVYSRNARRN